MTGQTPPQGTKGSFDFNTIIFQLWQGKLPLLQVFWIYYFAVVFALTAVGGIFDFLAGAIGLFKIVWAAFMVKPIWLAADAYKGAKHWAILAKVAAVLVGVAVVGELFF